MLPVAAVAVNVMAVVVEKFAEAVVQPVAAQLKPVGELLMLPLPEPLLLTVTRRVVDVCVNAAVT